MLLLYPAHISNRSALLIKQRDHILLPPSSSGGCHLLAERSLVSLSLDCVAPFESLQRKNTNKKSPLSTLDDFYFETAALRTCVLKKPPLVFSMTCW
jgi:hypothetical protein